MLTPENYKDLTLEYKIIRDFASHFTVKEYEFYVNSKDSPIGQKFIKFFTKIDPDHVPDQVHEFAEIVYGEDIEYKP